MKKTPLKRKSPLLSHQRPKKYHPRQRTKAEREHMDRVAKLGCVVCGAKPVELHHLRTRSDGQNVGMGVRGDHMRVVSLCAVHHRTGGFGVAIHGGAREFAKNFGEDSHMLELVLAMLEAVV